MTVSDFLPLFGREKRILPGRTAGFTLLEVLVSMAILAICLTVIMELFSGGIKSGYLSGEYINAVFLAREKMEEVLVQKEIAEGTKEGESDSGYTWLVNIRPEEEKEEFLPKLPFSLFDIQVSVMWREGEHPKSFTLHTLRIAKLQTDQGILQ
jgi:general secretion pathway protein I